MSEIKLSDEDIKRIAGEVVKLLVPPVSMPPIKKREFTLPVWEPTPTPGHPTWKPTPTPGLPTWKPTPTPGLPYGWNFPYSSFV